MSRRNHSAHSTVGAAERCTARYFTYQLKTRPRNNIETVSENEGIEVSSPKGTLKEAFRQGLIEEDEEQPFVQMLEGRNLSTHVYDELETIKIFKRVRSRHLPLLKTFPSRLMRAADSASSDTP